jgi:hypothetical protein
MSANLKFGNTTVTTLSPNVVNIRPVTTGSYWEITSSYAVMANTASVLTGRYDNIWVGADAMKPAVWSGSAVGTFSPVTGSDVDVLDFDSTIPEYAVFQIPLPRIWDGGTLKAKFYWTTTSNTTSQSLWSIGAGSYEVGTAMTSYPFNLTQSVLSSNVVSYGMNTSSATPPITVSGSVGIGNLIFFQIHRDAAPSSNLLADASLIGVDLQYSTLTSNVVAW